jgi:hypothetical protein
LNGEVVIWAGAFAGWVSIDSVSCHSALAQRMGIMVPVNYEAAALPLVSRLKQLLCPELYVGKTICWNERFYVNVGVGGWDLELVKYDGVSEDMDQSLCTKRVPLSMRPNRIPASMAPAKVSNDLIATFGQSSLELFMFCIGNCLVNGGNQDYCVILQGSSKAGKRTAISILPRIFGQTCTSIPVGIVHGLQDVTFKAGLPASRLGVGQDISFDEHGISIPNLKALHGGDPVPDQNGNPVKISMSTFSSTNNLPLLLSCSSWTDAMVTRRFIAIV